MPRGKIPTKAELIQLQKLYKTDEKIAERLGGVTPQLVAYWRRKKNIARHAYPKFSELDIKEMWERFGDDYRAGLELGLSKAAFYNWRRKYGIKEKPAFLKLEQLELNLGGPTRAAGKRPSSGSQTAVQKILSERSGLKRVEVDQMVSVEPDLVVVHDDAAGVIERFQSSGLKYVWNPGRIIISLDRTVPAANEETAAAHHMIRDFVRRQNLRNFYDVAEGSGHLLAVENGHILPGQLALGTDPFVASFGCIDSFAAGVTPSEMSAIWATGRLETIVPATIKVNINGRIASVLSAKDIALFIYKNLREVEISGKAIEFNGAAVAQMPIAERFTLCNFAVAMGARAAICPFDSNTRRYFLGRTHMPYRPALADKDAVYLDTYEFNIDNIGPQIAITSDGRRIAGVAEVEGVPVQQIVIGSCGNARIEDLRIIADILKGKKIHSEVRMLIYPASRSVYLEALKKGFLRALVEAGALIMNPGSGPCPAGFHKNLAPGEKCLTTAPLRLDDLLDGATGDIFLVSAATAAASALKGVISDPTGYVR
ncbi:3-isopropylmalate dehydratase large subunit (modular protein) [Candidatus Zixiibacteriota bacterium]|nr:3-isopropylmalate dehydratase large subunit (modular protein) [candidate division Zixibacteria bacterium]